MQFDKHKAQILSKVHNSKTETQSKNGREGRGRDGEG